MKLPNFENWSNGPSFNVSFKFNDGTYLEEFQSKLKDFVFCEKEGP